MSPGSGTQERGRGSQAPRVEVGPSARDEPLLASLTGEETATRRVMPLVHGERPDRLRQRGLDESLEVLDPLHRVLVAEQRFAADDVGSGATSEPLPTLAVEEVIQRVVRRIAWGGDARQGTARIEIGSGKLAGAVIAVVSNGSRIDVDIALPPGVDAARWRARLAERFEQRGLWVGSLCVS